MHLLITLLLVLISTSVYSAEIVTTKITATKGVFGNISSVSGKYHGTHTGNFDGVVTGNFNGVGTGNFEGVVTGVFPTSYPGLVDKSLLTGEVVVANQTALLDANSSSTCTNIVLNGSFSMSQDITITKPLSIKPNSIITTTGYTLTINSWFSATSQVFTGSGGVSGLKEVRPEWFATNTTPGTTDMTAALQAASVAAPIIIMDGSDYKITSDVTFAAGRYIKGAGISNTKISLYAASLKWEEASLSDINGGGISNVRIETYNTVPYAILAKNIWGFRAEFLHIVGKSTTGLATGITLQDYSFESYIKNCRITDVDTNAIIIASTGTVYPNGTVITGCDFSGHHGAILVQNNGAANINITNNWFEYPLVDATHNAGTGINLAGGSGSISGNTISGGYTATSAVIFQTNASNYKLYGNKISVNGGTGVYVGSVREISIYGNTFEVDFATNVVRFSGSQNCSLTGNVIKIIPSGVAVVSNAVIYIDSAAVLIALSGNTITGYSTPISGTGIMIDDGVGYISINGGTVYGLSAGFNFKSTSSSKVITMNGVHYVNCTTPGTLANLTASYITDCSGFVTRAYGTATIASGTTTVAVNHGLSITPPSNAIQISAYGGITNDVSVWWVSSTSATQITFACSSDPGTSGLMLVWSYSGL